MRYKRLLILGALLGLSSVSRGTVLTYVFTGTVTNFYDPTSILSSFHLGDHFVYTISFDTTAPNIYPDPNPNAGSYEGLASSLSVGTFQFASGTPFINTADSPHSDVFEASSVIEWSNPSLLSEHGGVSVNLQSGDVFDSPALPQTPYPIERFTYRSFGVQFLVPGGSTGDSISMTGTIESMVPEPLPVVGWAIAALFVPAKRRPVCV